MAVDASSLPAGGACDWCGDKFASTINLAYHVETCQANPRRRGSGAAYDSLPGLRAAYSSQSFWEGAEGVPQAPDD